MAFQFSKVGLASAMAVVLASLVTIVTIVPILVIVVASLKGHQEFLTTGPFDAPANWFNFDNYVTAFTKGKLVQGFVNTTTLLVISSSR